MFKPTYLYIKTHNKTGLKYFGKTTAKDPYKYRGSGVYWTRHIKTHGYDVSTEIIGYYQDEQECLNVAKHFSIENNIVKHSVWANLKEETLDGGWDYINNNIELRQEKNKRARMSADKKMEEFYGKDWRVLNGQKGSQTCRDTKVGIFAIDYVSCFATNKEIQQSGNSPEARKKAVVTAKITYKEIGHQQGEKNSQYGTMWITNGIDNKKIKKEGFVPEGWYKGRTC